MLRTRPILWIFLLAAVGCDTPDATTIVVDNDYAITPDGGDPGAEITVFKVLWSDSLLADPVPPGSEGAPERTVLNTDFAYALLAPGWDPGSSSLPPKLLPAKSLGKLTVARGDLLHVHVSDATFAGNCAAGKALSQDDADFVTQRLFPGDFPSGSYDAMTCSVRGGGDADAGGDAMPNPDSSDVESGTRASDGGAE